MDKNQIDSKLFRLYSYLLLNSKKMNKILSINFAENEKQNVMPTFYSNDSLLEIVYRLMNNPDFKNLPIEERAKYIYTDYYPEDAKVLESVYLDDRRGLCQEFHNRICKDFKIPATCIVFSDFSKELDKDKEYYYDPLSSTIFVNTQFDFSKQATTYLLQVVMQATYLHRLQIAINNLPKCEDKLSDSTKYVCYAELLKQTTLSLLEENGRSKDKENFKAADCYCASDVYSIVSSYTKLEEIFENLYLTGSPLLSEFEEARASFMSNLPEGEEAEELTEEDLYMFSEEERALYAQGQFSTGVLMDTLEYDYEMLQELSEQDLNKYTKGDLFRIFIEKLDENAEEFYGGLGSSLGDDFKYSYIEHIKEEAGLLSESEEEESFE